MSRQIYPSALSLFVVLCLASCSASWHIRQAERKDPSLFDTTTVVTYDTVTIETKAKDSTIYKFKDSIIFRYKDSTVLRWQIAYKDSVLLKDGSVVSCKEALSLCVDSVSYYLDCPDNKQINRSEKINTTVTVKERWWIWLIIAGVILLALVIFSRKK